MQFFVQYIIYAAAGISFPVIPLLEGDTFILSCASSTAWILVSTTDPYVYLVVNPHLRKSLSRWLNRTPRNRVG